MSFATGFLFLLVLVLAIAFFWAYWHFKSQLQYLEKRVEESLDNEDLIEFQENIAQLLEHAETTGNRLIQSMEEKKNELKIVVTKAKNEEKLFSAQIKNLEKSQERAAKKSEKLFESLKSLLEATGKQVNRPGASLNKKVTVKNLPKPANVLAEMLGMEIDKVSKSDIQHKSKNTSVLETNPEFEDDEKMALLSTLKPVLDKVKARQTSKPSTPVSDFKSSQPILATQSRFILNDVDSGVEDNRPVNTKTANKRHQQVYEMQDQGYTRDEIARETGFLAGEVELILNLRPKKH